MNKYQSKQFSIGTLKGISQKTIEEHIKLYEGYVSNLNKIFEIIENNTSDPYAISEARRRLSFEFNGMKNHEYYFSQLEGVPTPISNESKLNKIIEEQWGSFDKWLNEFKSLAITRGIGWAILYYDPQEKKLINSWVDEQHLGQLNGCHTILALDMWEHSFVADYQPSGKKQYVEDFFSNLNWTNVEDRLNQENL